MKWEKGDGEGGVGGRGKPVWEEHPPAAVSGKSMHAREIESLTIHFLKNSMTSRVPKKVHVPSGLSAPQSEHLKVLAVTFQSRMYAQT